jgi:hypothetical protein
MQTFSLGAGAKHYAYLVLVPVTQTIVVYDTSYIKTLSCEELGLTPPIRVLPLLKKTYQIPVGERVFLENSFLPSDHVTPPLFDRSHAVLVRTSA